MGCKVGEKILHWESSKDTLDQMAIEIQGYLQEINLMKPTGQYEFF